MSSLDFLFRDFGRLQRFMNRRFGVDMPDFGNQGLFDNSVPLKVDAYEGANNVTLIADLPGVDPKSVNITYSKGVLTVEGEKATDIPKETTLFNNERWSGKFRRTLSINTEINADNISAEYQDGVLTVTLPKAEAVKPKTIMVKAA